MATIELPYEGFILEPSNLRFKETIVFTHHWGGQKNSPRAHMDYVASLGFRSISFSQSFHSPKSLRPRVDLLPQAFGGLRHVWAQELSEILDLTEGDKILFSFSMPSGSALMSLGDRNAKDIKAWICDGGPFLKPHTCYWNYFKYQKPIKNWILRESAVLGSYLLFGNLGFKKDAQKAFSKLPSQFPILSIRGWQDPLVPPSAIEELFSLAPEANVEVLSLPEAGHIDGLKKSPNEYKTRVKRFLEKTAELYV